MRKHSSPILHRAAHSAARGLGGLLDEARLVVGSSRLLRDAFDADELPVSFILRRDSRRREGGRARRDAPKSSDRTAGQRSNVRWPQRRGARKKRFPDE